MQYLYYILWWGRVDGGGRRYYLPQILSSTTKILSSTDIIFYHHHQPAWAVPRQSVFDRDDEMVRLDIMYGVRHGRRHTDRGV